MLNTSITSEVILEKIHELELERKNLPPVRGSAFLSNDVRSSISREIGRLRKKLSQLQVSQ